MQQPLVSVIIPAYNSGPVLVETLESVLRQTYRRREIIVVDDGSTDDTRERVACFGDAVSYIWQTNAGPGAARNTGLRVASGDYIALLDHDDLWLPEKLEIQLEVAGRHPETGMVVCDGVAIEGETILSTRLLHGGLARRLAEAPGGEVCGYFYRDFIEGGAISCPGQTLIPRHVVQRIGPLTPTGFESSDIEYYLRIALAYPITLHRHSLVRYRYLPSSVSGPADRRPIEWSVGRAPALKRQTRLCPAEDRDLVLETLRTLVRRTARDAYHYGRREDVAYARSRLIRLWRVAPWEPRPLAYLTASWLPESLVATLAGGLRRIRALWRAL